MALRNAAGAVLTRAQVQALTTPVVADPQLTLTADVYEDSEDVGGSATGGTKLRWHAGDVIHQSELDAVYPAPTITGVAPANGGVAGGTAITITGTGFERGYESLSGGAQKKGHTDVTVSVGGAAATNVQVVDDSHITCTTPAGTAGAKSVVVTTAAATVTDAAAFTYA